MIQPVPVSTETCRVDTDCQFYDGSEITSPEQNEMS